MKIPNKIQVQFVINNYFPGQVQCFIQNEELDGIVKNHIVKSGGTDLQEDAVLIYSEEENPFSLGKRKLKDLNDGWTVSAPIDAFDFLSAVGYDANKLLEG